jgi:CRISPR-associated exonuclease Cas4
MYAEDDLSAISALQHLLFCERQCALIHIEKAWAENQWTVEGKNLHERVHEQSSENRPGIRIARGLRLRSLRLGLVGMADVVEFHMVADIVKYPHGQPYPVEYKRGKPKAGHSDEVQLCAQALCLEEMLNVDVPAGSLFYGTTRRRCDVLFDDELRGLTIQTAERLHILLDSGVTPRAEYGPKCEQCSLLGLCMPKTAVPARSVACYLERMGNL